MHTRYSLTISFILTCLLLSVPIQSAWGVVSKEDDNNLTHTVQSIQIPFLENTGQLKDDTILFWARTLSGAVHVTESGALLYSLPQISTNGNNSGWVFREEFLNSSKIQARGDERANIAVNFINGDRKTDRHSNVPAYNQVSLGEIYPGIEARLKAYGNNVEKLFIIHPDSDPGDIFINIAGAEGLTLGLKGELEVRTGLGTIRFTSPLAYQEINGQRQIINVAYCLEANGYRFSVGPYDHSRMLIIDPLLASTFIGEGVDPSSGPPGVTVAADSNGQVFVAGSATTNFPTTLGVYSTTNNGGNDVFVLAMDRNLTTLQAATFIGGNSDDRAYSMAVGDSFLLVSGWTKSTNFPTHTAAYDRSHNGGDRDVFLARLAKDLTPASYRGSFLGGSGNEQAYGIALQGNSVYLTGSSSSANFPVTDSSTMGDFAPQSFVAKMDIELSQLEKATLYGGSGSEEAFSIALGTDSVYIGGSTTSTSLPGTTGADLEFNGGDEDGFIAHFNSALEFQNFTYLGGNGDDRILALALNATGELFAAGGTGSPNFPSSIDSYDPVYNGGSLGGNDSPGLFNSDGFIAKFNAALGTLQSATFWGGRDNDMIGALAFDGSGNIILTGQTSSNDLPLSAKAYQNSLSTPPDTYLAKIDGLLQNLVAASYLGGTSWDVPSSVCYLAANDSVYLTGVSWSGDFPTTAASYKQEYVGTGPNIFVAKIDANFSEDIHAVISSSPGSYNYGTVMVAVPTTKRFVISNLGNTDLVFDHISLSGNDPYQFEISNDSCSAVAISPAGACNITVTFTPLSTGVKSADLKISSNAINAPTLTIGLTGTGTGTSATYTLTIQKDGSRVGVVTSEFGELNCGPTCTYTYDANTTVNLTPSWNHDTTVFSGWSGGCSGTSTCTVTMNQNVTIKATFRDFYPTEVSKTGLTTCFDSAGSSITCADTGQDGEIQAGVLIPSPRFTDNGDGTITDHLTGLMWLQDANCFSGDLDGLSWQDAMWVVKNFNQNPAQYDCAYYYDKYNDWVLPNINELESLITDETSATKQEWLYDQNFENVVAFGDYWTSTTWAGNDSFSWFIYISNNMISYQSKSREKAFIWPVRSE